MCASITNDEPKEGGQKEIVLQEIPQDLIRLVAYIAKAFYGTEYYVVLHYVYLNTCISEDDLRKKTTFDQRFLRRILAQLKMDKILKERCDLEGSDGRSRKLSYYYINYRGMLNVVKYKIDHMRRRMEIREHETAFNATYKCTGCECVYEALDMDRIFDVAMGEMKCFRCQHQVIPDQTTLPTEQTRSLLARFNEQMLPLFSLLERLEGIRLAHHLLEPSTITAHLNSPSEDENDDKILHMSEFAISGPIQITHSEMQRSGSITVCIENENSAFKMEEKQEIPWLHNDAKSSLRMITGTEIDQMVVGGCSGDFAATKKIESSPKSSSETDVEDLLMDEFNEETLSYDEIKATKGKVEWDLDAEWSGDEDDDTVVYVQGVQYKINDLTPKLVLQMTEAERDAYARIARENFDYQFS